MSTLTLPWDRRFMRLAREIASWSKDPSTGTGCVLVNEARHVVSLGYNGFPSRFPDLHSTLENREQRLAYTIHAEVNAVLQATGRTKGTTAYVYPWPPCVDCAKVLSQAWVKRVVALEATPEQEERWGDSFRRMEIMFRESRIVFETVTPEWLDG